MSAASDRANAAMAGLGDAAADLVLKQHAYAEALAASSQAQDVKVAAEKVFATAQAEVDAAIEALKAEKTGIISTLIDSATDVLAPSA